MVVIGMRDRPRQYHNTHAHHRDHFHVQAMPLEEVQGLLPPTSKTGRCWIVYKNLDDVYNLV